MEFGVHTTSYVDGTTEAARAVQKSLIPSQMSASNYHRNGDLGHMHV